MRVLCFDPGKSLGYSLWDDGVLIRYGTKAVHGEGMIPQLAHFIANVTEMVISISPDVLVVEDTMKGHYQRWESRVWLVFTCVYIQLAGFLSGVGETHLVSPKTLKMVVAGHGSASKPDMIHAVNEIQQINLEKKDHNTADAIAIGIWYYSEIYEGGV